MKTCPQCSAMVSDTAKFCIKCGFNIKQYEEEKVNLKLFCSECGKQIPVEADFCPECGVKIEKEGFLNNNSTSAEIDFSALDNINAELTKQLKEKDFSAFEYDEHSDGTYTITGLKDKTALKYEVPNKVEDIANGVFKGCKAITVTLPEGLIQIGDQAFKDCKNLTQINLPKSLKFIGNEAFFNCELLNIEIPSSVLRVGYSAIKNTVKDVERQKAEAEKREKERIKARKEAEAKARKTVGATVSLGLYKQGMFSLSDDKHPIAWQVLEVKGNKSLLISKCLLEAKCYNDTRESTTWSTSSIRKWLNKEFFNTAFNNGEKKIIQNTYVVNADNKEYGTNGGPNTYDNVFLLSIDELNKYFPTNKSRGAIGSYYARKNGLYVDNNDNSMWWLRSPGCEADCAIDVYLPNMDTSDMIMGTPVNYGNRGVRPVLWINNEE